MGVQENVNRTIGSLQRMAGVMKKHMDPYMAAEKAKEAIENKQLEHELSKPKATILPFEPRYSEEPEPNNSKKATIIPFPKESKKATIIPFKPKD